MPEITGSKFTTNQRNKPASSRPPAPSGQGVRRVCRWKYDNAYGYYDTACGNAVSFDAGIKDNGFLYCPYCGKRLSDAK